MNIHHFFKDNKKISEAEILRQKENKALKDITLRKPLTDKQEHDIEVLWTAVSGTKKRFFCHDWYEIYNITEPNPDRVKYYIPNDFYYGYVDGFFSNSRLCKVLDNKEYYELLFPEVTHPKTLIRRSGSILTDGHYQMIDTGKAIDLCKAAGEVIVKPSMESWGGVNIKFWHVSQGEQVLREILNSMSYYVVQGILGQHSSLNAIHSQSINTIRVLSFIFEGEVHVLSSVLRMGVGNSRFDNASAGGLFCGITHDGVLKDKAYDKHRQCFERHPQGAEFAGVRLPSYNQICEQVKMLAPRLATATRIVSWDYAVEEDGTPVLVEANMTMGGVNVHQETNGPVFGDMTERVLRYVFEHNEKLRG